MPRAVRVQPCTAHRLSINMTKSSSELSLPSGALWARPLGPIFVVGLLDDCDREWLRARVGLLGRSHAPRTPRSTTWRAQWRGIRPRRPCAVLVLRTLFTRYGGKLRVKKDAIDRLGLRTSSSTWPCAGVGAWHLHCIRTGSINDGDTPQHRLVVDEDLCEHTLRMFLMGHYQRLHITLEGVEGTASNRSCM
jgi:hypothetical protein